MSYNQIISEVKPNNFFTIKDKVVDHEWMNAIWIWADGYQIKERVLPRNKKSLLSLKKLTLIAPSFIFNISETRKKSEKERLLQAEEYVAGMYASANGIDESVYIPKEIGRLKHLEEFCISFSPIERLPDEIVYLQDLKELCLCYNRNLILTDDQKLWIRELEEKGVDVNYDEDLLYRSVWSFWE